MKKIFYLVNLFLISATVILFVSCGGGGKTGGSTSTPVTTSSSDEEQIMANWQKFVSAYNSKNAAGAASYISTYYGCDYNCIKSDFQDEFDSPDYEPVTVTVKNISISENTATMYFNESDYYPEYWVRESGTWKIKI